MDGAHFAQVLKCGDAAYLSPHLLLKVALAGPAGSHPHWAAPSSVWGVYVYICGLNSSALVRTVHLVQNAAILEAVTSGQRVCGEVTVSQNGVNQLLPLLECPCGIS